MADTTDFLNTPAGQAILRGAFDFGGGALTGLGQAQIAGANRDLSREQLLQQLLQQNYQFNQGQDLQRGAQGLAATQMNPAAQSEALSKALTRGEAISNARPSQITAPSFLSGFTPNMQGGAMGLVPAGGFSAVTKAASSPSAILASANNFYKNQANANPRVPTMDLGPTFGDAGSAATAGNEAFRGQRADQLQGTQDARTQALQIALQKAQQDNTPGEGFWHKFAKYAGIAGAGLATALTAGGASPLLVAAIGAGSGAAAGWGGGGGVGGALGGAAMGGLGGYAGAKFGGGGGGGFTPSMPGSPMTPPGGMQPLPQSPLTGPYSGGPTGNDTPNYGLPQLPKPGQRPANPGLIG